MANELFLTPIDAGVANSMFYAEVMDLQTGSVSINYDPQNQQCSFDIYMLWSDLEGNWELPGGLAGYSKVDEFNNLSRIVPWRCPYVPWLYCVGISNLHGVKFVGKLATNPSTVISTYWWAKMTATFASLPYSVIDDQLLDALFDGDESYRYIFRHPKPTANYISIDRGTMQFVEGADGNPKNQRIPTGVGRINVKVDEEWTWFQVPDNYLFNISGQASSIYDALGTVNVAAWHGFPAQTLLFLPPEFIPRNMPVNPQQVGLPSFGPPRAWDVVLRFQYYDPPNGSTTRGHNLAYWPGDNLFYLAKSLLPPPAGNLLFQTTDFNSIFDRAV